MSDDFDMDDVSDVDSYEATPNSDIDIITDEGIVSLDELIEATDFDENLDEILIEDDSLNEDSLEFEEEWPDDTDEGSDTDEGNDEKMLEFMENDEDLEDNNLEEALEQVSQILSKEQLEQLSEAFQDPENQEQLQNIAGKNLEDAVFDLYCLGATNYNESDIVKVLKL